MSHVITNYVRAWEHGDLDGVLGSYSPEIVAHYGGTSSFAGDHHGIEAFVNVLAETSQRSERRLVSIEQLHDAGDHGSVFVVEAVTIDGAEHLVHRALRFRVDGDHIAEVWLYDLDQHVVDRSWCCVDRSWR